MEEYISDNSVYARAKSNSMINPKMIGRVLGTLLLLSWECSFCVLVFRWGTERMIISIFFIRV